MTFRHPSRAGSQETQSGHAPAFGGRPKYPAGIDPVRFPCERWLFDVRAFAFCVLMLVLCLVGGCGAIGPLRQEDAAQIRGKTYVLFGASSGFGQGVALQLARHGANMVIAGRREGLLSEVAQRAQGLGGRAIPIVADITDPADIAAVAAAAISRFGRVDVSGHQ
ncbi:MAG: dehydrogenase with different specificity (related to short-chain alcohol dehydrogenase)-like [Betaproteobacteria bacterium]|nr:dehydrogenase with different specificity (related to short-chain alcohol dehydrogenase)-like [Betaproteobacteria bacterium]